MRKRFAPTLIATAVLISAACEDAITSPAACRDDATQSGCIPTAIGAVQKVSNFSLVLIDRAGDRLVTWDLTTNGFSQARDVSEASPNLPLGQIGASSSTKDGILSYFFDTDAMAYTILDSSLGTYSQPMTFGPGGPFGSPDLTDVGALVQAANTNRIFFFDRAGTSYQLLDYASQTWTAVQDFNTQWGGGNSGIASVGAAVLVDRTYYLFDTTGTEWITFTDGVFTGPFATSDLGDGTLNFN